MWQPIDTAPKDGSPVLFFYPEGRFVEDLADENDFGHYEPDMAVMRWEVRRGHGGDPGWWGYYDGIKPNGAPTYWRPLPEPPERVVHTGCTFISNAHPASIAGRAAAIRPRPTPGSGGLYGVAGMTKQGAPINP